jgi:hypothetical protein
MLRLITQPTRFLNAPADLIPELPELPELTVIAGLSGFGAFGASVMPP